MIQSLCDAGGSLLHPGIKEDAVAPVGDDLNEKV